MEENRDMKKVMMKCKYPDCASGFNVPMQPDRDEEGREILKGRCLECGRYQERPYSKKVLVLPSMV